VDMKSHRRDAARCEVEDANEQVIVVPHSKLKTSCAQHLTPCDSHTCLTRFRMSLHHRSQLMFCCQRQSACFQRVRVPRGRL
jgi:hypothetical protein